MDTLQQAQAAYKKRDFRKAIRVFEDVLRTEPNNVTALRGLLACWTYLGNYNKADLVVQQLLRIAPDSVEIKADLAELRFLQHRYSEAIAGFQSVLRLRTEASYFEARVANAYAKLGQRVDAERYLAQVRSHEQLDPETQFGMASTFLSLGQPVKAIGAYSAMWRSATEMRNRLISLLALVAFPVVWVGESMPAWVKVIVGIGLTVVMLFRGVIAYALGLLLLIAIAANVALFWVNGPRQRALRLGAASGLWYAFLLAGWLQVW